ncbi:rod shape-determining protein [Spirillospora sp. NPDC048911]|uniref:rod shape-determining protein n=1 Tax=Spirillospora sp. NPDC048911 TaxID=3364527 RepID=UPI00371B1E50
MGLLSAVVNADTALDLGTVHSRIFVPERQIRICVPSVVMVSRNSGRALVVGRDALEGDELGWRDVELVRPVWNGTVTEYGAAVALVRWLLKEAHKGRVRVRPRVAVAVPSGAAKMERRALEQVVSRAGARQVLPVDHGLAAALGHQVDGAGISARMVADLGGNATRMAIVAKGRVWTHRTLPVGGLRFDQAVAAWALREYRLVVSMEAAERSRVQAESLVVEAGDHEPLEICGQDLDSGKPTVHTVTAGEIASASTRVFDQIVEALEDLRNSCDPELTRQLLIHGLVLSGGGALAPRLPTLLRQRLDLPVHVNACPQDAVVIGAARYLGGPWTKAFKKQPESLGGVPAMPVPASD